MRIAVAGFSHESNTFSSMPTNVSDFRIRRSQELIDHYTGTFHEIAGFIAGAQKEDFALHPILAAGATPAGPLTPEAYETFCDQILQGLAAAPPLDGILLALHGAMVTANFPQADAETVRRVRQQVGPDCPIVVTHDYHGNVPAALVEAADALIIYKTNPHIDQLERGLQAASIIARTARGEIKPTSALVKPEVLFNIYFHNTSIAPMQPLMQAAIELEQSPGVLACSIAAGYQYADVEAMGPSIVVITDNQAAQAQTQAQRLGQLMWAVRQDLQAAALKPAAAVTQARQSNAFPVTLLDFGDNIGGGSSGDSTFILEELLKQQADGWVMTIWDPAAAQACFNAGIGHQIKLQVGGKTDTQHGPTLEVDGRVRTLHNGAYQETERRHGGGTHFNQGKTAVLEVNRSTPAKGGLLILNSHRVSPNSIHQITSVGIQPHQQKILVAKGAVAPRAAYEPVSAHLIEVDSPGATSISRSQEEYKRARKTLYEWQW
jgi:microcystin degradation protein MlrC